VAVYQKIYSVFDQFVFFATIHPAVVQKERSSGYPADNVKYTATNL